jgi:LysR family transcriptional regulator, regulator for metE and metH
MKMLQQPKLNDDANGSQVHEFSREARVSQRLILDIGHLRLIDALARHGNLTRCAAALHLSQSALSHRLIKLERELGVQLFDRVGKRMIVSSVGAKVVETARRVLSELGACERELKSARFEPKPFRVAGSCDTQYGWLAALAARFAASHPECDLSVSYRAGRAETALLNDDDVDIVITGYPPNERRFAKRKLFAIETIAVMSAQHRLAKVEVLRWRDLAGETLLVHQLPDEEMQQMEKIARGSGARKGGDVRAVQLTETIAELAREGKGIGVLSRWIGPAPFAEHGLVVRSIRTVTTRTIWAVWLRSNPRQLPIEAFARFVSAAAPNP